MIYWVVLATIRNGQLAFWSGEVSYPSPIMFQPDVESLRMQATMHLDLMNEDTVLISWTKLRSQ